MKGSRTRLRLRVVPGARRPGIVGRHGEAWKVRVSPPAEGGANDAVLDLLASTLAVSRRDVTLTAGAASRDKVVALEGMTADVAETRLAAAAEGRP